MGKIGTIQIQCLHRYILLCVLVCRRFSISRNLPPPPSLLFYGSPIFVCGKIRIGFVVKIQNDNHIYFRKGVCKVISIVYFSGLLGNNLHSYMLYSIIVKNS